MVDTITVQFNFNYDVNQIVQLKVIFVYKNNLTKL